MNHRILHFEGISTERSALEAALDGVTRIAPCNPGLIEVIGLEEHGNTANGESF